MRKLFILICIFCFACNLHAQRELKSESKLFEKKEFNLDSAYLALPRLYFDESEGNNIFKKNDWLKEYLKDPSGNIENIPQTFYSTKGYNMPIYTPPFIAQMPIQVPDSSVKYKIRIKDLSEKNFENRLTE